MNYTVHQAKARAEEEDIFNKDRSVFKNYIEDTHKFLLECLNEDIWFGKIEKIFKKDVEEFQAIKAFFHENYKKLINIFDFYSGISDYPVINMMDVTSFSHKCNILDPNYLKLADHDLILIATNVTHHQYLKSEERNLQRYEFLEFLLRIAIYRYIEPNKILKTKQEALERLLEDLIYPNA